MPEQVSQCPLCGNSESSVFDQRISFSIPLTNQLCNHCGLVYQTPRLSTSELDTFYEETYRKLYQNSVEPTHKDLYVQKKRAEHLFKLAQRRISSVEKHLDIGCSSGILLMQFRMHFQTQAVGIEPGTAYREYAQQQGLRIFPSLDDLAETGEAPFDLISMAHVLEHLPDPVGYLTRIREQFLSSSGWLLIEVPNLYAHDCFEVAHLVSFSPHTLKQTVEKAGYQVISVKKHGNPRSDLIPLYLTIMAQPVEQLQLSSVMPEKGVKLKRSWGFLLRKIATRLLPGKAWRPLGASS